MFSTIRHLPSSVKLYWFSKVSSNVTFSVKFSPILIRMNYTYDLMALWYNYLETYDSSLLEYEFCQYRHCILLVLLAHNSEHKYLVIWFLHTLLTYCWNKSFGQSNMDLSNQPKNQKGKSPFRGPVALGTKWPQVSPKPIAMLE